MRWSSDACALYGSRLAPLRGLAWMTDWGSVASSAGWAYDPEKVELAICHRFEGQRQKS